MLNSPHSTTMTAAPYSQVERQCPQLSGHITVIQPALPRYPSVKIAEQDSGGGEDLVDGIDLALALVHHAK